MATASGGGASVSDQAIVALLAEAEWPLGSTEVAAEFDISQQAAYARLRSLAEEDRIERKTTGGTTLWRPR